MSEPTIHAVSKELARLDERMNTHEAKYEGALDPFRADMDSFRANMAKRDQPRAMADRSVGRRSSRYNCSAGNLYPFVDLTRCNVCSTPTLAFSA